jgi:hypothetical protein
MFPIFCLLKLWKFYMKVALQDQACPDPNIETPSYRLWEYLPRDLHHNEVELRVKRFAQGQQLVNPWRSIYLIFLINIWINMNINDTFFQPFLTSSDTNKFWWALQVWTNYIFFSSNILSYWWIQVGWFSRFVHCRSCFRPDEPKDMNSMLAWHRFYVGLT